MSNEPASSIGTDLLATIMADESFRPSEPGNITETGLPASLIESLMIKRLAVVGSSSGRQLSNDLCIPFNALENMFQHLRSRQIIVHTGSAPLNDYHYSLTESGRDRAAVARQVCAYSGPAPVPLMDYVLSAEAQTIRAESPKRSQLKQAFSDISINELLFESLGPAINSGAGLFLYGEPGNGKSTLAQRITQCFGHEIWVPHAIFEDGQIIKFFDGAYHQRGNDDSNSLMIDATFDRRWVKIRRPTVVVGGELTMDALEIRHDPGSNISEASLQMKSNCGCLLVDDFGRQRIEPQELLNRWIVPLESRIDFLALSTGKKIQVPFEQLIIFSTNLEPADLVDEAFLRRIPYKIEIGDPTPAEFHELFQIYCDRFKCEYRPDVVDYLLNTHFLPHGRRLRRCHPRDLLNQIRNFCVYNELRTELRPEYIDRVVRSYFTVVLNQADDQAEQQATGAASNPLLSKAASADHSAGLGTNSATASQTVLASASKSPSAAAAGVSNNLRGHDMATIETSSGAMPPNAPPATPSAQPPIAQSAVQQRSTPPAARPTPARTVPPQATTNSRSIPPLQSSGKEKRPSTNANRTPNAARPSGATPGQAPAPAPAQPAPVPIVPPTQTPAN